MIHLFQPDLFSISTPKFSPINKELQRKISTWLHDGFSQHVSSICTIQKAGGLEINSNNFLIKTTRVSWLCKILDKTRYSTELIHQQCKMVSWLTKQLPFFPVILKNDEGNYFFNSEKEIILLMPFINGKYFSGRLLQFSESLQCIFQLFNVLSKTPPNLQINEERLPINADQIEFLLRFDQYKKNWISFFGIELATILEKNWVKLAETWKKLLIFARSAKLLLAQCHVDIHPHNILINKNAVAAVLDYNSLLKSSPDVLMSYGVYKLWRQTMSYLIQEVSHTEAFFCTKKILIDSLPLFPYSAEWRIGDIFTLALLEVSKRMYNIFNLNVNLSDKTWNAVLLMMLRAIHEIEYVHAQIT